MKWGTEDLQRGWYWLDGEDVPKYVDKYLSKWAYEEVDENGDICFISMDYVKKWCRIPYPEGDSDEVV